MSPSSPHSGHLAASQLVFLHWRHSGDGLRPISCRNCAEPLKRPVRIWCTSTADDRFMSEIGGRGGGSRLPSAPGTSPLRTGLRPSSPVCLWPYAPWPGGSLLGIRCWCRAEPHSVPWPPPPSPARRPRRSRGSHGARGPTAGRRVVPRLPSERARRSRTPSKEPRSGAVSSPSLLAVSPLLTLKMSFSSFTFASSSFSCRL